MADNARMSRGHVLRALEDTGGNRVKTAEDLGISRATLYRLLKRHGIEDGTFRRIGGRYDVVRKLGRGAHSIVYLVRDRTGASDQRALKLLSRPGAEEGAARADRTIAGEEYSRLSRLRHPGIVRVHDIGVDVLTGRAFLVMDFVPGRSFLEAARERSVAWIVRALRPALETLAHLHRAGVVHRDIKSENVLVDDDGEARIPRVTVMDLGLAESLSGAEAGPGGTLLYAAPEVLEGERASARSDLYAVGVLAYRALSGRWPHEGNTPESIVRLATSSDPRPLAALNPGVPAEVDRVVMRLLARDPARRHPDATTVVEELDAWLGHAAPKASIAEREFELVGRGAEIETVLGVLAGKEARAGAGMPRALAVVGERGAGKSRFLTGCTDALRSAGWRVAHGRCREDSASGMEVLREIFSEALAGADARGKSPDDRLLARYAPVLETVLPELLSANGAVASPGPRGSRAQALDVLASLLSDLAERQRTVVAIDDLHLGDPLILDLFWLLARRARRSDLRLLATTSVAPDGAGRVEGLLQGATTEGLLTLMPLQPLSQEAARKLAEATLGVARAAVYGDRLWEMTGGHPLFLNELLQEIRERRDALERAGDVELPRTAREAIRSRLGRVGEGARRALAAIAVAGRPQPLDRLGGLLGPGAAVDVEELLRRQLATPDSNGRIETASRPIREVVLAELDEQELRSWHACWAEVLAGIDDALVERANHLRAARDGEDIGDVLLAAAQALRDSWHYDAAIELYRDAIDRLEEDDPSRLAVYPQLEVACREAHDPQRAAEACREWGDLAQRLGDTASEAHARSYLASSLRELRRFSEALEAARRAVELAEASGEGRLISLASKSLALVLWVSWRKREALGPLERALELSRTSRDAKGQAYTLQDVALLQTVTGHVGKGLEAAAESRDQFERAGDEVWKILTGSNEALILAYLGDLGGAIDLLKAVIEELRGRATSVPLEAPLENLALLLNRAGRYEEALVAGQDLVDEATRLGRHGHRISGLLCLGDALYHLDERDKAREHHELARGLAASLGEERQRLFAELARVRDLRSAGRLEAAAELARAVHEASVQETAIRQQAFAAIELARIALGSENPVDAHHWLDDAESASQIPSEDGPTIRAAVMLERCRAWRARGRPAFARAAADEGLALASHRGPVEVEIGLRGEIASMDDEDGNEAAAEAAYGKIARLLKDIEARIEDPLRRARFSARPDVAAARRAAAGRAPAPTAAAAEGRRDDLESLYEVTRAVAAAGDVGPLLERIVALAVERSGAERGLLMLCRDDGTLEPAAAAGIEPETAADAVRISRSVIERTDRGASLLVPDTGRDETLSAAASVALFDIRSVMCVPLAAGGEQRGALYVDVRGARAPFNESRLRFLEALAQQAAIALGWAEIVGGLTRERDALRQSLAAGAPSHGIIGRSEAMRKALSLIERVAPSDMPVLVLGESGTGKELIAKALHRASPRAGRPMLSENCAAVPFDLLESTLFGHVRGAFTGADRDKLGLFELADGGTLFLDEIGDMPPGLQAKLLRVLQEKQFRPVGAERLVKTDVRIVAATHRDLQSMVQQGTFRQDLYFRLNSFSITLTPLRDRREDIEPLIDHFLESEAGEEGSPPVMTPAVRRALVRWDWPGNVRELENVVRRLCLFADRGAIDVEVLRMDPELAPLAPAPSTAQGASAPASDDDRLIAELEQALEAAGGNRDAAANLLGVSRATLYRRMKAAGLTGHGRRRPDPGRGSGGSSRGP